tara:strand:- start:47887 stop:48255 length:369 start_codon:yes stop_codon:yes gene_type:complete
MTKVYTNAEFDMYVARKMMSKMGNAKERGIEFALSFQSMKNLLKSKKCYYTGLELTKPDGKKTRASDLTIDRIDASKGYVPGNVVACSYAANHLKSQFEKGGVKGLKAGRSVFDKTLKRMGK